MRGHRIEEKLGQVTEHLARLDAMLIVREPNTVHAAEAYEGLRKSVQFASQQQRIHISTLIGLLEDLDAGATLESVRLRIQDRLSESGVLEVTDPESTPEAFIEVDGHTPARSAWVLITGESANIVVRPGARRKEPKTASPDVTDHSTDPTASTPGEPQEQADIVRDGSGDQAEDHGGKNQ